MRKHVVLTGALFILVAPPKADQSGLSPSIKFESSPGEYIRLAEKMRQIGRKSNFATVLAERYDFSEFIKGSGIPFVKESDMRRIKEHFKGKLRLGLRKFIDTEEFCEKEKIDCQELDRELELIKTATTNSEVELPIVSRWIAQNGEVLDAIHQAAQKSDHVAFPMLYNGFAESQYGAVANSLWPELKAIQDLAQLVSINAQLQRHQKKHDMAWTSCLTLFRMARILQTSPPLLAKYIAMRIEKNAIEIGKTLDRSMTSTAKRRLADLMELASIKGLREGMEFRRLVLLDGIMAERTIHTKSKGVRKFMDTTVKIGPIDWSETYKIANQEFEKLIGAIDENRPKKSAERGWKVRVKFIKRVEEDLNRMTDEQKAAYLAVNNLVPALEMMLDKLEEVRAEREELLRSLRDASENNN